MNETICLTLAELNQQSHSSELASFLLVVVIICIFSFWIIRETVN